MSTIDDRVQELVARFTAPDALLADLLCDGHDPDRVAFRVVHDDLSTEAYVASLMASKGLIAATFAGAVAEGRERENVAFDALLRAPESRAAVGAFVTRGTR